MKLSKDELLAKINEKVMEEDVKIELIEDVTDSFEIDDSNSNEEYEQRITELEDKYKNLQEKYKERFLNKVEEKEDDEDDEEKEEVIDVKEI